MAARTNTLEPDTNGAGIVLNEILAALVDVTACFAQAATALSSAARSMAIVAEAFSKAGVDMEHTGPGSDSAISALNSEVLAELSGRDVATEIVPELPGELEPMNPPSPSVSSSKTEDDYFTTEDETYLRALIERQRNENRRRSPSSEHNNAGNHLAAQYTTLEESEEPLPAGRTTFGDALKNSPPFRRSLLLSSEVDVLPVACAIACAFDKVICYLDCSTPAMVLMYQKIIKGLTQSSVYAVAKATPGEVDRFYRAFKKQDSAILLLPETVEKDLTITSADKLCVIHIGWPCNTARCFSQISSCNPAYSVLVACSSVQDMYPTCDAIQEQLLPWPEGDHPLLEREVFRLRSNLENVLAGIPAQLKEDFYCCWIESHGSRGRRYVQSWNPPALVARANLYIKDVLKYSTQEIIPHDTASTRSRAFPAVSLEFVERNGLQTAVDAKLLNVRGLGSSVPSSASMVHSGDADPKIVTGRANHDIIQGSTDSHDNTETRMAPYSRPPGAGTLRLRYLVNQEPDIFPVICSMVQDYDVVYCYLAYPTSLLELLFKMLDDVTDHDIAIRDKSLVGSHPRPCLNRKTIVLIPSDHSICIEEDIDVARSCTLQVGWPTSFENYQRQMIQHDTDVSILVAWSEHMDPCYQGDELIASTLLYDNYFNLGQARLEDCRNAVKLVLQRTDLMVTNQIVSDFVQVFTRRVGNENFRFFHTKRAQNLFGAGLLDNMVKNTPHAQEAQRALVGSTPTSIDQPQKSNIPVPPHEPPVSSVQASVKCLIIEDIFDSIPAICYYARNPSFKNIVCYVRIVGVMQALASQIRAIVPKPVFVVANEISAFIPSALRALSSPSGCLVICNTLLPLPNRLKAKNIHQVIYAGWIEDCPHYQQQTDCNGLLQKVIISTRSERDSTLQLPRGSQVMGEAKLALNAYMRSQLDNVRELWRHQLRVAPTKALNSCYIEWILYYGAGSSKSKNWSVVDLVRHANGFARSALLRGLEVQGGQRMLGGQLAVTESIVQYLKLWPAVEANILRVDG
ncbi:hypothetical protein RhiJN_18441 [Ceratobasidium sp. AG-Ba]|nr:hypothetical protein RhiJN_18441 [Ceratobasidium sp. AG-Ba]